MKQLKLFFEELPRPVRIWSVTIGLALAYIVVRYFQAGGQEGFHLLDRAVAAYSLLSLLIFLGFFMTKDPE